MLSASLLITAVPVASAAGAPIKLYLNGQELYLAQSPVIVKDRVLVPMRAYLEALGAEITWQPPDLAGASLKGHTVQLQIGSTTALIDGSPVAMDVPAQLIADRTYLPLRFLSEGLGAEVEYHGSYVTVETPAPAQLQVIDGPLNVRQEATTSSPILTTVPNGTVLDIVHEQPPEAWTQIRLPDGKVGWVANQYTRHVANSALVDPFLPWLQQAQGFLQIGGTCVGAVPLVDSQVVVPLRQSVEQLGGSVSTEGTQVTVSLMGHELQLSAGTADALLDGEPITLHAAPSVIGGQVMIHARTLAESFGLPLKWSDSTRTLNLGSASEGTACTPAVSAHSYVIMDAATGVILSEYNSRSPHPIASTTKIMTALLAIERGDPGSVVTVSWNAANQIGTSVYLRTGEQRTLDELLYGLMLVSGNDAATAIAEHIAGSESAFVQMMNQRAVELGAYNTRFYTASGLDDWVDPYSTARDLATIARYAIQNPYFRVYMSQKQMRIPGPAGSRLLTNSNLFTQNYPGATGVKNGWTEKANHTVVASAYRDNREILVVLLGAPTKTQLYDQAYALMDHGFRLAESSWLLQ